MSRDPNQNLSAYPERNTTSSRQPEVLNTSTSSATPYSESGTTQMATLPLPSHVQPQIAYRPHAAYSMYSPHSQSFPPSQQPPTNASQQAPNFPPQPAPRQRTAIACQYCRRRKIRCHGFDSSPVGKCTNCVRFHQDCMFLPVSTQGHAFVPAHTAYPALRTSRGVQAGPDGRPLSYTGQPGPLLYNHQGQPLPPTAQHDPAYGSHQQPAAYMSSQYQQQPPLNLPPPAQGHSYYDGRDPPPRDHRPPGSNSSHEYPDPNAMAPTSPASSSTSYQTGSYPQSASNQHPYYQSPSGASRISPTSSYFPPRMAVSSHGGNSSNVLPPLPPELHPPLALPAGYENGRNTSPNTSNPRAGGLGDILTPTGTTRSSTDSDMLNALDRKRR